MGGGKVEEDLLHRFCFGSHLAAEFGSWAGENIEHNCDVCVLWDVCVCCGMCVCVCVCVCGGGGGGGGGLSVCCVYLH